MPSSVRQYQALQGNTSEVDVSPWGMSDLVGHRGLLQHESDHNRTQILSECRSVRVVLYGLTPAESEHRFWIDPEVTFGGVTKALAEKYPSQELVILQANWGPRPSWTESHPDSRIGSTCRVLYAILKYQAKPYTVGVVRTSLSDYPIPIYIPVSKSSTTLLEGVIASYPKLTGQVKSIVLHFGDHDLQDNPWDNVFAFAQGQPHPATPLVVNTLDEPLKEFLTGSLYEAFSPLSPRASTSGDSDGLIPPLLQIPFAECKLLVQRAYELNAFPLQMIHLSEAIFHVVISLARSLTPVFGSTSSGIGDALSTENDLADHLRVAPLLSRQLERLLDDANRIMNGLELGPFKREGAQYAIEKIFVALCGDLPGAVTVRRSEKDFKKFGSIDCESIVEDKRVANADPMMDLDYHSDVTNFPYPSEELDWRFSSGKGGHDPVGNGSATGHFFNPDPHSGQFLQQGGIIPDPRAYQGVYNGYQAGAPLEYDQFTRRHAPATEHDHLHRSLPRNSFMGADASTASSSSSVWPGLTALAPAPSHLPAPSSSSFASPSQRLLESPVFSQYPSHAQTSLPLQAMVSNSSQGPSEPDAIKLSDEQTEAIKALLLQHGWYVVPDEEPAIRPDDPFITQGLILPTDKTRFGAFVFSISTGGRTFCRMKHTIPTKNQLVECKFSATRPEDAIAHVCDYLNYRPYKCKGTKWHTECASTYPTKERRNDHYAKKKKGPDSHEPCVRCGASITARNVARHKGKCHNTNNIEQSR